MNIAKTGYLVSDSTLVQLTQNFVQGIELADGVRISFLRILVAHSKRALGKWNVKRATHEKTVAAMTEAYDHLYAVVLEAVTTKDLLPDPNVSQEERTKRSIERNRRSTFARSAKATLSAYLDAGGRLSSLDPATVTKEQLRQFVEEQDTIPELGEISKRAAASAGRLEAIIAQLAEEDGEETRKFVEALITRLRALIPEDEETAPPGKVRQVTTRKKRVGELTLHPH